ncbi:Conserved_hypothetical protein [Hexamita inflata]|uniref:Uncharacterized protein n=1 Tax=Hexamita inflata TaxID=28002 RepID=A0AA86UIS2_9EUKA|nr:Conserved hypothetical protein [Hexamita inflata]
MSENTFKQCFSPASTLVGNRLTRTLTLNLLPNPLMKFIPTDNMCQVLNGKSSSAVFLLQSPLNGKVQVPSSGTGIPFTYLYNQNITISYQFSSLALYDQILDAQFGAFKILLDGEYEVQGSVADVFHTLSNQTACFSSARFTFSLIESWFSFEVEPLFCNVASFTVYFEYYSDNKWLRIPVHAVEDSNVFVKPDDYKTSNTQFLSIKRYLLDVNSASESSKYSAADRSALENLISTVTQNISTPIRLSLDYFVKSTTASITAIAEYKFSDNSMGCFSAMTPKTTINENGLIFKTGFQNSLPCLEVPSADPRYSYAQYVKEKATFVQVTALITTSTRAIELQKVISFNSFVSIYLVQFYQINEELKRQLIDSDEFQGAQIQLFVVLVDANGQMLLDFSSKPIELKRTCVNQRVMHIYNKRLEVVIWTKQLERCNRPAVSITLNYFGMQLQNDIYQIVEQYGVTQLVNFSRKTDTVPITCENSLGDKKECQINMTRNMKTNVRDQIVYFVESASELSQIQYKVMETNNNVWKDSIIVFGVSFAILLGCILYYLFKEQQKQ